MSRRRLTISYHDVEALRSWLRVPSGAHVVPGVTGMLETESVTLEAVQGGAVFLVLPDQECYGCKTKFECPDHGPISERRREQDETALDLIHKLLDGKDWSPDTTQAIAGVIEMTGRVVKEFEDCQRPEAHEGPCGPLQPGDVDENGEPT